MDAGDFGGHGSWFSCVVYRRQIVAEEGETSRDGRHVCDPELKTEDYGDVIFTLLCRWLLWESKGYVHATRFGFKVPAASGCNDDVLAAIHGIRGGCSIPRERKCGLPEQLTGGFVEGAEFLVVVRGPNEKQSARSDDRPAVILRTGILHALCHQFRVFAERNLPDIFAGIEVDGIQRAPRRLNCGVTVRIEKAPVTGKVILHRRQEWARGGQVSIFSGRQKIHQGIQLFLGKVRETRHPPFAFHDSGGDLMLRQPVGHADKRRNGRRRTGEIFPVTHAALAQINSLRAFLGRGFRQGSGPDNVIGIYIKDGGIRVDRGATPFRPAIKSRKDDGVFSHTEGNKLTLITKGLESFERPLVYFGRA